MKINNEVLSSNIKAFNTLSDGARAEIIGNNTKAWTNVLKEYLDLCNEDSELCKLEIDLKELRAIDEICSFDLGREFPARNGKGDFDTEDDFEHCKNAYENLGFIEAGYQEEINESKKRIVENELTLKDISAKRTVFKKKQQKQIDELKREISGGQILNEVCVQAIEFYKKCAQKYADAMKKEELRKHYLSFEDNKKSIRKPKLRAMEKRYNEITLKYASKLILQKLDDDPSLICYFAIDKNEAEKGDFCFDAFNKLKSIYTNIKSKVLEKNSTKEVQTEK